MTVAADPLGALAARVGAGASLIVLLDVDGTLAPIAPRPEDAEVPTATREVLARLVARPRTHVALVSGRAARDAQRLVGVPGVWVIGNHGAECVAPNGARYVDPRVARFAQSLDRAAASLDRSLGTLDGVRVEHKTFSVTVHVRLAPRDVVPRVERVVHDAADGEGLRVATGKEVLELRAPVDVDKGTAVLALLERLATITPRAAVLYVGDDVTDEDAFRRLGAECERAVTVRVGAPDETTAAGFVVDDPAAVRALLSRLAALP